MLFKNLPGNQLILLIPIRLILDGLAGIKFLFDGDFKDTFAVLKSHFSFYLYVLRNFSKRRKQQQQVFKHPSRGIYKNSIVVEYFIKKKKHFKDLPSNNFS